MVRMREVSDAFKKVEEHIINLVNNEQFSIIEFREAYANLVAVRAQYYQERQEWEKKNSNLRNSYLTRSTKMRKIHDAAEAVLALWRETHISQIVYALEQIEELSRESYSGKE